ncbi:MAG: cell division protein [Alphaproteobacteria bacterium]|nr:cell division protein [Alphaproteobacteria bacterium]
MNWRQRDLALSNDPTQRFLPWMLAMIVYLAGLSLAGMMSLSSAMDRWDTGLKGTVTVQVPAAKSQAADGAVGKLVGILRRTKGVIAARPLDNRDTANLLRPWIGGDTLVADLPLPRLIDVRVETDPGPDLGKLRKALDAAVPGTVLDDHKKALDHLVSFARSVELVGVLVLLLVALAGIATVIFITRTGLAIHHEGIEILHLMGALDSYVAGQFQGQALELGLKGGAIGLAFTAATVGMLSHFSGAVGSDLLPKVELGPLQWLALAAVPIGVTAIAMVTARITVIRTLQRLP